MKQIAFLENSNPRALEQNLTRKSIRLQYFVKSDLTKFCILQGRYLSTILRGATFQIHTAPMAPTCHKSQSTHKMNSMHRNDYNSKFQSRMLYALTIINITGIIMARQADLPKKVKISTRQADLPKKLSAICCCL